ncbi:gluconate 2-dehydrogenase subunit 3 family protein [Noviherbaspirillum galbum]|uniref:Gluconate 2-dehydrogenase subunit 3 family protein n=1 Tax=Noviherbaspirillum galbum TaxID=2709383 RepID=A0A6B3SYN2_9BURK|nr:gluconate 2-dehydrogenase subunit 3 family protein [Noviherbaspirillum galbum]NEX64596.1 gluconate 2-dehydrogenase subunit 3 family protein [Noviherbaspirillum galbum]
MTASYPGYDVLAKWDSPSFDDKTRKVLDARLRTPPARRFFSEEEWRLMEALADRLLPQPDRADPVPIVAMLDEQLFFDRGEGFRHEDMPRQQQAWRAGLAAIDAEARLRFGAPFAALDLARQDGLLQDIANNAVNHRLWEAIPAERFFIHFLLKGAAGVYYSHPSAWSEIGFGGPASPRGYVRLGFNGRDPWDAREEK